MSKYSAVFQIGWMTVKAEAENPKDLVKEIEKAQDLQCLVQMSTMMGTKKDKQEIKKLIRFIEKNNDNELTIEDIRNLDVKLSVGTLRCDSLNEEQI